MKSTWNMIWWMAGLMVVICGVIVFIVLFRDRGDSIIVQYDKQYPELDPNEKLPDISFGWYRPPSVDLEFKFIGSFPKVPDKMLVYKILRPQNVTEAYVREIARKFFNIPIDAKLERSTSRPGGSALYWLKTQSYLFEFDPDTGFFNIFKHEKAREKLSEDRKDYPSDEECKRIATEYLKERGLLPEDAYLSGMADNIEAVGAICVWFGRTMGQFKTWGPGSEILVAIGVDGEITKVSKRWYEYEPYKLAPIRTPKEAFEQLKHGNAFLATSGGEVTKIALAYYTPPEGDYVQPVYNFGFGRPGAVASVPAVKQEYLKSQNEMIEEIEQEKVESQR